MRYYSIVISDPVTGQVLVPDPVTRRFAPTAPTAAAATYTSLAGNPALGVTIPGALNVEIDAPVYPLSTPGGGTYLRIWGISLTEIAQQNFLGGKNIDVYAGMQKGLPLANPQQAGLLLHGQIFQAFGNWQGVEQTLDLIINPRFGTPDAPANISLDWRAGTPLSEAIASTLSVAFPSYKQIIAISPKLVLSHDEVGFYSSLSQLAQVLNGITKTIIGGDYPGVDIWVNAGKTLVVADGTESYSATSSAASPKQINFQDMIGQPTWIDAATVSVSFVMRADLSVRDFIRFPTGDSGRPLSSPFVLTLPSAAFPGAPSRNQSAFSGVFYVRDLHHFGNFRQPDANSWVTMVNAVSVNAAGAPINPTASGAPTRLTTQ